MTIVMAQQGWQCPNCGNIISPNMMWCPFCSGEKKVTYTTTTSTELDYLKFMDELKMDEELAKRLKKERSK